MLLRMAAQVQSGLATGSEGLVCFVCDVGVVGRYYTLASCRTQTTKVRLIEKLGQLVGEDYMVVISEDDVICRGCATMINSLDRLEKEVGSLRSIVLRYLEKKYEMEEGELVNARANAQVAPAPARAAQPAKKPSRGSSPTDFQSRKRKAAAAEFDSDETQKENWLQCDKCKYTTQFSSFMVHHMRSHDDENSKVVTSSTDEGSGTTASAAVTNSEPVASTSSTATSENTLVVQGKTNGEEDKEEEGTVIHIQTLEQMEEEQITPDEEVVEVKKDLTSVASEGSETVEMIAAEIGQDFTSDANAETIDQTHMLQIAGEGKAVTLQTVEGEDGANTICMVDENGMILQKVEQAEDGTLYVQMGENPDPTKQVLSVADDGSVQMVEVLWDEMVNTEDGEGHEMVSFLK